MEGGDRASRGSSVSGELNFKGGEYSMELGDGCGDGCGAPTDWGRRQAVGPRFLQSAVSPLFFSN